MKAKPVPGHRQQGRWILASLEDITTPIPGRIVYKPAWWKVTENDEVLFFDTYDSPQCNQNRLIAESLASGFDAPATTVRFLALTFLPHNCSDYC